MLVVDRRGDKILLDRDDRGDGLHGSGRAEQVTRLGLGGTDGKPPCMLPKEFLDRQGLDLVVQRG